MMKLRVKHLEPVYIGYLNETKYALVTEDGSKFYPNDLVYHKSIDVMFQKLGEKDKDCIHKLTPNLGGPTKLRTFYLSEKEFADYCEESLKYLEPLDSRSALVAQNIARNMEQLSDLKSYQYLNQGRKIILRMMCDRRVESYDDWELLCEDLWEACCMILLEEGRRAEKKAILQKWVDCDQQTDRRLATVKTFENFLKDLEIDTNRIILVPDIHFIRQWIELPLIMDYNCATIITPGGEEYYRPIQAQLRFFERLVCDIDWEAAYKKHPQKTQLMRGKITDMIEKCENVPFHSPKVVDLVINQVTTDNFFADSKKRIMMTPLYMCQRSKYNDTMPMSEFRKLVEKYDHDQPPQDGSWKSSTIEMWKVRHFFLVRWVQMFCSDNRKLSSNLLSAITMQVGIVHLKDAKEMYEYSTKIKMNRYVDFSRIKMLEEMAEKSGIKKLDDPKQIVVQESSKRNRKTKKPDVKKSTLNTTKQDDQVRVLPKKECEVNPKSLKYSKDRITLKIEGAEKLVDLERCQGCDEKEKKLNDEIETLKRQLAEKSKLLEDRENRVQSDGMRLHEMQRKLEEANKLVDQHVENAKEMEKSSRTQANKIKEDYKNENQKLKEKLMDKEKRFKQLEMELKEVRENVKNEQKKKNSKENDESKIAEKTMKRMKVELEMAKLTEKTNCKKIEKLEKENRQLRTQMEILEEQYETNSSISEKDEQIRELTEQNDNLKLENIGTMVDIEEVSMRNRELLLEIDRLNNVLLEVETSICQPSTSSNHVPFAELQNQLEDRENIPEESLSSFQHQENHLETRDCLICRQEMENDDENIAKCEECRAEHHQNCLSQWLKVNSTCPACRLHWPDEQEFPAL